MFVKGETHTPARQWLPMGISLKPPACVCERHENVMCVGAEVGDEWHENVMWGWIVRWEISGLD